MKNRISITGKTPYLIAGLIIFLAGLVLAILSLTRLIIFPHLTPIGLGIGLLGAILAGYTIYGQWPSVKR